MAVPKRCFEVILLVAAMVASAGAFIGALFVEIKYTDLNDIERGAIETISDVLDQNELFLKTQIVAGLAFATTGLLALIGFIALVGRLCNVQHEQKNRRIFTCLYVLFILVCFAGFAAAGVLGVFTSIDWSDILSFPGFSRLAQSLANEVEDLRNSVAATSACSLLAALIFVFLEVVVLFCCAANKHY